VWICLVHSVSGDHEKQEGYSDAFLEQCRRMVWRKRYNHELYELFNELDIVNCVKINRLGWAGHVIRTDNNRTVKVFNTKPIGIRKTGRHKLRWEDDVIQDIKTLGVRTGGT
jgi:hypothetical protein